MKGNQHEPLVNLVSVPCTLVVLEPFSRVHVGVQLYVSVRVGLCAYTCVYLCCVYMWVHVGQFLGFECATV